MALSFRLNRHEEGKKYRIGDHLTGVVNIHSMERMAFDVYDVAVSLRCYSDANLYYSEGEFGAWYKEKRTLLEVSQTLTSRTFTIEHDTEWLFDIEIPAKFTPNGTGFVALAPATNPPLFDPRSEQPIPPTTKLGNRPGIVQGEGDMEIFYMLEAEIRQSGALLNSTDARRSIDVIIVPERRPEPLHTTLQRKERSLAVKSLLLNSGVSATLKEKLHATFHSNLVPESHFTVALLAPECVAPGQPFTLHFRVVHDFQKSNAQELPLVELTALEIRLKRKEIMRTSTTVSSRHTTATWRHEKDVRSVFYLERRLPITIAENTRLSEHGISLITPDIMPVTFATINAVRQYWLKIDCSITYAKKTFKWNGIRLPLSVKTGEEVATFTIHRVPEEVIDSGLPTYEDVVEYREVAGVSTSERPPEGPSRLPSYHSAVAGLSRR